MSVKNSELEVFNPFDGSQVGSVKINNANEIEEMLESGFRLHKENPKGLSAHRRIQILHKASSIMREEFDDLSMLIAAEGGKPLIDARVEVERAIDGVLSCASEISNIVGSEIPMGLTPAAESKIAFTTREPIGLVIAISAFNHPLNLIVHQVAPAVATGCPVIVKPADDTPLSCQRFISILAEAGLPKGWAQMACCDVTLAQKMVTDQRVNFFSFIGSAKVGWHLRSLLSPGTRMALEHGGAAPVILDETADIDLLVPKLAKGGFYHSGQVCVSVQRVFMLGKRKEEIVSKLGEYANNLTVGNAINEKTECGPLIRNREVDRVESWVNEAQNGGAKVIAGGKRVSNSCYAPTVLLNPPKEAAVSKNEIFGPVINLYESENLSEAISQCNSLPFAFQSSIFSNNYSNIIQFFNNVDASAVMVNDHTAFRVDWMPFAGRNQSGYGIGGIPYTMEDMTKIKMAVLSY